jgi:ribonuclease HII
MGLTLKALRRAVEASSDLERLLQPAHLLDEAATHNLRFARSLDHERARLRELITHEQACWQQGITWVAGVDEVGRGPLAGPLVAAAVVFAHDPGLLLLDDSKKRTPEERALLVDAIHLRARAWSIAEVSVDELNHCDLHRASLMAMARALAGLTVQPEHVLVDGCHRIPGLPIPQTPLVKGDSRSASIAAASVLAKVHRDNLLDRLDQLHPEYGFARHKGYGTAEHLAALHTYGATSQHRLSFAPVAAVCKESPRQLGIFDEQPS